MPLSGTFDTIQLCDLMQWIHTSSKGGFLTVSIELEDTYLVFRGGDLVALGSDDPLRLDVGQVLLSRRIIDEAQLAAALRQVGPGKTIETVLLEEGAVTEATIAKVQHEYAFETVLNLFFVDEGSFHFTSGSQSTLLPPPEIPNGGLLRRPIPLREVIFEAMHRLDEWNRMRLVFPNSYVVVQAVEGESDSRVWQLLRDLGEPLSVGELCLRVGGTRFDVYKQLYEAYNLGLISLDLMPTGRTGQSHLAPSEMLLENARVLIAEQQYDEAREVLSTLANLDPDNQDCRALLRQLREAQLEHLYQQIPPHRVPILTVPREQLKEFALTPREAFLASRLSGKLDVATLVVATPVGELETMRALRKFFHSGIATFVE